MTGSRKTPSWDVRSLSHYEIDMQQKAPKGVSSQTWPEHRPPASTFSQTNPGQSVKNMRFSCCTQDPRRRPNAMRRARDPVWTLLHPHRKPGPIRGRRAGPAIHRATKPPPQGEIDDIPWLCQRHATTDQRTENRAKIQSIEQRLLRIPPRVRV